MFNDTNIKKLEGFYADIDTVKAELTEEYSIALESSKDKDFTLTRKDKEVTVKGSDLWYEVQNLGANCQAGEELKKHFPKVFELSIEYDNRVNELNTFAKKELNVDPLAMTLLDVVKIAKGIIENK
jgi:hypothetical protein